MSINSRTHPHPPSTSVMSPSPTPSPTLQPSQQAAVAAPDPEDLRRRLEKLCRHYDVDTMKVFIVVEGLGQEALHAVYCPDRRHHWEAFLQRSEACRLDLTKHDKTRDRYHHFLTKVGREEQGRQWFQAVLRTLHYLGAADLSHYLTSHATTLTNTTTTHTNNNKYSNKYTDNLHSPRRHEGLQYTLNSYRSGGGGKDHDDHQQQHQLHHHSHHHHSFSHRGNPYQPSSHRDDNKMMIALPPRAKDVSLLPLEALSAEYGDLFCQHLVKLFEKKLEVWFEAFHAIAVRLTAHVKVAGLVRVLSGQVHALGTRQGRLTAVCIKVTGQDTPRPLDVAELCLTKVMVIQNGLALPEDLDLALLTLHVLPARPVLRLWLLTPSPNMEAAIRVADIDDMIDAGRLSQRHELWPDNTTTEDTTATAAAATVATTTTIALAAAAGENGAEKDQVVGGGGGKNR